MSEQLHEQFEMGQPSARPPTAATICTLSKRSTAVGRRTPTWDRSHTRPEKIGALDPPPLSPQSALAAPSAGLITCARSISCLSVMNAIRYLTEPLHVRPDQCNNLTIDAMYLATHKTMLRRNRASNGSFASARLKHTRCGNTVVRCPTSLCLAHEGFSKRNVGLQYNVWTTTNLDTISSCPRQCQQYESRPQGSNFHKYFSRHGSWLIKLSHASKRNCALGTCMCPLCVSALKNVQG